MFKIVIILSVIAFFFVVYDALRTKAMLAKPGGAELILKITRRRKRRACMLLFVGALFFMGAGVWQCIEPSVPPYGASAALLMDLANFALGIYGPAMVFFALGTTCFIASMKRIPGAFFQHPVQARQ